MNIGVDFDGVLFDTESMFRALSQIENVKIGGKVVDSEQLRLQKRYNWTKQQIDEFMSKNMLKVHNKAPIMPYAKQVLKFLSKNHRIYAITSRGMLDERDIEFTNQRLKDESIEFDKVVYCASDKLKVCRELQIDLMIDDLYDTVIQLAENGIKCLYYRDIVLKFCNHKMWLKFVIGAIYL